LSRATPQRMPAWLNPNTRRGPVSSRSRSCSCGHQSRRANTAAVPSALQPRRSSWTSDDSDCSSSKANSAKVSELRGSPVGSVCNSRRVSRGKRPCSPSAVLPRSSTPKQMPSTRLFTSARAARHAPRRLLTPAAPMSSSMASCSSAPSCSNSSHDVWGGSGAGGCAIAASDGRRRESRDKCAAPASSRRAGVAHTGNGRGERDRHGRGARPPFAPCLSSLGPPSAAAAAQFAEQLLLTQQTSPPRHPPIDRSGGCVHAAGRSSAPGDGAPSSSLAGCPICMHAQTEQQALASAIRHGARLGTRHIHSAPPPPTPPGCPPSSSSRPAGCGAWRRWRRWYLLFDCCVPGRPGMQPCAGTLWPRGYRRVLLCFWCLVCYTRTVPLPPGAAAPPAHQQQPASAPCCGARPAPL
jgi:hypothetical protein